MKKQHVSAMLAVMVVVFLAPGIVRDGLAQQTAVRATPGPRSTAVHVSAWRADNSPLPRAQMRLRNVATGKIAVRGVADGKGVLVFRDVPTGAYVVELVDDDGRVRATGHTFVLARGQALATFVRLPPEIPWFQGFFGNIVQTVSAAAAGLGITAVLPESLAPVSAAR